MSINSEEGVDGRPGIRIIFPVIGIKKLAPTANSISRTVIEKPFGRPNNFGLSESYFWVFAIQIGKFSKPNLLIFLRSALAFVE